MKLKLVAFVTLVCLIAAIGIPAIATDCSGLPGDVNNNSMRDYGDLVYLSNYVFKGGPAPVCMTQADCNCDGNVDVGDVVYLSNYLFKGGPPPVLCWY